MARPREFDEARALDGALLLFWRQGYDGCSVRDLVEATGVQRQSLYNTFEDKRGLFLAALRRYRARVEGDLAPLAADTANLASIRRYMEGALKAQHQYGSGACLLVTTAFGPASADPEVRAAVEGGAAAVRAAFAGTLARCVACGELPATTDVPATAATLYAVLNGLSALGRTGGSRKQLKAVLDQFFAGLAE